MLERLGADLELYEELSERVDVTRIELTPSSSEPAVASPLHPLHPHQPFVRRDHH